MLFWAKKRGKLCLACSVQFKMVSARSEKPICAPRFPNVVFVNNPSVRIISRKIVERFLFPRLSPPGDRWCDVLDFLPVGSVK